MDLRIQLLDNCRALFGEEIRLITYTRPRNTGSMSPSKIFYHAMILPDYSLSLENGKECAFLGPSTAIAREGAIMSLLLDSEKMIGSMLQGQDGEEEEGEEEEGNVGDEDKEEEKKDRERDAPASRPLCGGWERFIYRAREDREIASQTQSIDTTKNAEDLPGSSMERDMQILGGVPADIVRPAGEGGVVEAHTMFDGCVVGGKPGAIGLSGSPSIHPPAAVQDRTAVPLLIPSFEERSEHTRSISPTGSWNSLQPGPWDWENLGTASATTTTEGSVSGEENGGQDWAKCKTPVLPFSSGLPPTAGEDETQSSYRTAHDRGMAEEGYGSEFSQTTPSTSCRIMTPCSTPTRGGVLGPGEATEKDLSCSNRDLVKSEVALAMKGLLKAMARQVETNPGSPPALF